MAISLPADLNQQILQQEDYIRWLEKHRVDSSEARGALAGLIKSLADVKRSSVFTASGHDLGAMS